VEKIQEIYLVALGAKPEVIVEALHRTVGVKLMEDLHPQDLQSEKQFLDIQSRLLTQKLESGG